MVLRPRGEQALKTMLCYVIFKIRKQILCKTLQLRARLTEHRTAVEQLPTRHFPGPAGCSDVEN